MRATVDKKCPDLGKDNLTLSYQYLFVFLSKLLLRLIKTKHLAKFTKIHSSTHSLTNV